MTPEARHVPYIHTQESLRNESHGHREFTSPRSEWVAAAAAGSPLDEQALAQTRPATPHPQPATGSTITCDHMNTRCQSVVPDACVIVYRCIAQIAPKVPPGTTTLHSTLTQPFTATFPASFLLLLGKHCSLWPLGGGPRPAPSSGRNGEPKSRAPGRELDRQQGAPSHSHTLANHPLPTNPT